MGSTFGLIAITYGLPGIAICTSAIVMAYARKNEKRIECNDKSIAVIHKDLENINKKLDAIVDHFMIEGMKK